MRQLLRQYDLRGAQQLTQLGTRRGHALAGRVAGHLDAGECDLGTGGALIGETDLGHHRMLHQ